MKYNIRKASDKIVKLSLSPGRTYISDRDFSFHLEKLARWPVLYRWVGNNELLVVFTQFGTNTCSEDGVAAFKQRISEKVDDIPHSLGICKIIHSSSWPR